MSATGGASPAATPFGDRLAAAVAARESQIVLGIDPDPTKLWPDARRGDGGVARPARARAGRRGALHRASTRAGPAATSGCRPPPRSWRTASRSWTPPGPACVAVKPQLAHFERLGFAGLLALEATVAHARAQGLLVIADAKRGDIASTAAAYAQAWLGDVPTPFGRSAGLRADAMTLNPLLGARRARALRARPRGREGAGLFVLVRTSNPGAADLFDLELADGGPLWERLARLVAEAGTPGPRERAGRDRRGDRAPRSRSTSRACAS